MNPETLNLLQFAGVCTFVVSLKVIVPRAFKGVRAQSRFSRQISVVSCATGRRVLCDERSIEVLNDEIEALLDGTSRLYRIDDVYQRKMAYDSALESVELFARAFRDLNKEDRQIVEKILRNASYRGRATYL